MEPLSKDALNEALSSLNGWTSEGDKIKRDFEFDNFKDALSFIVRVGFDAEDQGHHPELFNVYNSVTIHLSTHDADGKVTEKDINLAKAIDEIYKTA
jgi:4a-hydroxytetrahydrobiopterin dehydratase